MKINQNTITTIISSILVGALFNVELINHTIISFTYSTTGYSIYLYAIIYGLVFLNWILTPKRFINIRWVFFSTLILIWFLVCQDVSRIRMANLICYVVLPTFVMSHLQYDIKLTINSILCFSSMYIITLPKILSNNMYTMLAQNVTYTLVPSVIIAMFHYKFFQDKKNICYYIFYIVNIIYLYVLTILSTQRGNLLCILISLFVLFCISFDDKGIKISSWKNRSVIITGLLLVMYPFFEDIMFFAASVMEKIGINAYFITKTIRQIGNNDISNGRIPYYLDAWKGFLSSPIWGNGFDSFEYYTGKIYVHNVILQILFDGGLIALIAYLFFIVSRIKFIVRHTDKKKIVMMLCLMLSGVLYILVSLDIYTYIYFWIFLGFLMASNNFLQSSEL